MAAFLDGSVLSLLCKAEELARPNKQNLPLPHTCHLEIPESVIAGRKVFIIGDVHGCYDEMCSIMELAKQKANDILFVFVGDLINKGSKSVEVVRKLRQMQGDVFSVRGNHEESVLREVRNCIENSDYKLQDKYEWIKGLDSEDVRFIKELPYTITIPSLNIHIVHAGILPKQPFGEQDLYNFTNMRNIIYNDSQTNVAENLDPSVDATIQETADSHTKTFDPNTDVFNPSKAEVSSKTFAGRAWVTYWTGPGHVYFGHDAIRGVQTTDFATGLDTGCVYGNCLTGVFAGDQRSFIQVKSQQSVAYVDD